MVKTLAIAALLGGVASVPACSAQQKQATRDYLNGIVSRIDVQRVAACANNLPDYKETVRCLGGFAVDTVSDELKVAIDRAVDLVKGKLGGPEGTMQAPQDPEAVEAALADLQLQIALAGTE